MTHAADVVGTDAARPADRARQTPILQINILVPMAIALGSLLAGAIYTWFAGEDVNWDWQNYHEYNVWAVINGRYGIDALPAGFQAYFNPTVYFPVYYLRHLLPPPYGLMIIGAVHGLNLLLIYFLVRVLLREAATASAIGAAILIAAVGPMTLSEVGTSFSDILAALPIVAGCILILSANGSHHGRYILAGLLIGAAVGLKLTNVVYALGAAAAVLVAARPLLATLCLGVGGLIGALATGGAWGLMLWREMGNPIFPLFNAVFQSKELVPMNIMDWQFMPRGLLDALAYPFYWLVGDNRSSEYPFRDARFAVAMVLIVLGIGRSLIARATIFSRRDVQFLLFFAVSYATWLALFAIQRYAIVLELLCAPLIVLLIARCMAAMPGAQSGRISAVPANSMMVATALCVALWSQPGDWFRRPWSDPYNPTISKLLEQPALYFLLDKPLAYVAPLLPPQSRFYQIADIAMPIMPDGEFDRRIRTALNNPLPGGAWELHTRGKPIRETLLERYGLRVDASRPCVEIEGAQLGTTIEACPLAARER
ncbi:glycosyltransferase 87 family protein [Bradyrhizobium sp. sBnM-33]|uniref:glycosyltransferase 87 family protein n=1 Tax=Bradyrhizobium sp. sBnM-33 TaxID=2831780 RepID=UPI00289EEE45|nr:glycosyltransferase 87 family protein [Bradyrhizobium sp. sBnM-33]WOH49753.1 glycosyltransferase 87 family protein [Bradyrhizobium sp. sBnM-33]